MTGFWLLAVALASSQPGSDDAEYDAEYIVDMSSPVCIRDTNDDPAQIRAMFGQIDRMAWEELRDAGVGFYSAERGAVVAEEFVRGANFFNGREDASPLLVTGIRLLQFSGRPRPSAVYVVGTRRSAWLNFGSATRGEYIDRDETWLVRFHGCGITTVREMPDLYYLLEGDADG